MPRKKKKRAKIDDLIEIQDRLPTDEDETRVACFRRYVEGDRITLKELAELFRLPYRQVVRWSTLDNYVAEQKAYALALVKEKLDGSQDAQLRSCRELYIESYDPVGFDFLSRISGLSEEFFEKIARKEKWDGRRDEFQSELRAEVHKVHIKEYARMLAQRNRKMITDHLAAYKSFEDIVRVYVRKTQEDIFSAYRAKNQEELGKALANYKPAELKRMIEILDIALKGQARLAGLDYFCNHNAAVSLLHTAGYAVRPLEHVIKLEAIAGIDSDSKVVDTLNVLDAHIVDSGVRGPIVDDHALPGTIE